MAKFLTPSRRYLLIAVCCLSLTGCKEVLFSDLEEIEANEMVAILAASGIDATRERDKDNIYSLLISASDIATATTLLRVEGYPKPKFQSLGDVFSAEGIVGTPFEQHARYIHAMNEELSRTVTSISGVRSARVLVTAPPKERYEREAPAATASVTINYDPGFDIDNEVPKIKAVIAHSLPNLEYDNVAVAFFPTSGPQVATKAATNPAPTIIEASLFPKAGNSAGTSGGSNIHLGIVGTLSLILALGLGLVRFGPALGLTFGSGKDSGDS
ncbi:type III secretion system inner membrane ring lipoprotein SctJ [Yoonia sp. 2307UL14-13]|uniref:type III secretion system inner membrane ring lipoprotein SctJ n=1 Tax=Yoonia sp. 2307UL14-13 TaxID=3126506 RepID=UPI0030B4E587